MSSIQSTSADAIAGQRDAFIEKFLQSAAGAFSLFSMYISDHLGLYRILAARTPGLGFGSAEADAIPPFF